MSVCQCVHVVKLAFCHSRVSFPAKSFFTTVNLVRPVTVYNIRFVSPAHPICRMFPSIHSIQQVSIYTCLLVSILIFYLWLQSLIFHEGLHLLMEPHLFQTFNMCLRQLKFSCFLTLFNAISVNQPTQYILAFNILMDIILFFLVYLKFCSNISDTLYYIKQNNHVKLSFDSWCVMSLVLPAALTWTGLVILPKLLF